MTFPLKLLLECSSYVVSPAYLVIGLCVHSIHLLCGGVSLPRRVLTTLPSQSPTLRETSTGSPNFHEQAVNAGHRLGTSDEKDLQEVLGHT